MGHIYKRGNIVNDTDLKLASQKQETYLESQKVTIPVTIHDLQEKRVNQKVG